MVEITLDVLSWALITVGAGFSLIGAAGLLRMPDVFTRLHAASLTETMGAIGMLCGLMLQAVNGAYWTSLVKLALILGFLLYTSPVAAHTLAQAALRDGVRPKDAADIAERSGEKTR